MSALRSERPVLILGSGRCGSTLLQSILNTNLDFVIWGEHNGFLRQIAAAYYDARHERFPDHSGLDAPARIRKLRAPRHWPAWDNLTGEAEFIERFREFIRSFFADPAGKATRWGFKEIRYGRSSKDQTLKLMLECFPETRIIILIRSPEATIFSILSHWTFAAERQGKIDLQDLDAQILAAAHSWNVQYMHLHNLAQAPGKCLKLRYEDLTDAVSYGRLSQFLDTSPFQYKTALARVKDASKKTDPTAVLIRRRLRALQAEIEAATSSARAAYGYDGPAPLRQVKTAI